MKSIIVNEIEFKQKDVVVPVSRLSGNPKNLVGFDVTIFKNRYKGYDDVDEKYKKILEFLKGKYGEGLSELSENSFYLDNEELFIDLRLDYRHNFNAYNEKNKFHIACLNELIEKGGDDEKEIIYQWCFLDVNKRKHMDYHGYKFLEVYEYFDDKDLENQIRRVSEGLTAKYTDEQLDKELQIIRRNKGSYKATPIFNKIATHFNPVIFKNENEHFKKSENRRIHLENCKFLQYLPEHQLTDAKILLNYRFNKLASYYSYFAIPWAKMFLNEYKPTRVLDMFGGWGYRYLAFLDVEYIYNDWWVDLYNGAKGIHDFCSGRMSLPDKVFYNEDATKFEFNKVEKYDVVYCCPPYENLEIFDNKRFKNHLDFLEFWDKSVKNSIHKDLKYFVFVIKNTLGGEMVEICEHYGLKLIKEQEMGSTINHHYNRQKSLKKIEHMYVMSF